MTRLKGMTWNHPRGFDPMIATSKVWTEKTGVTIDWDKRSLQDFESFPVEELARQYDLIVIDHPHVGQITAEQCLAPLDIEGCQKEREALRAGSVGQSYDSYFYKGHQWGFPIDAATQVMAYRPDRLDKPPQDWESLMDLAKDGRTLLPLRPPHSLMTFFTLSANIGAPCHNDQPDGFIDMQSGAYVFEHFCELARLVPEDNFNHDPIAIYETLSGDETKASVVPFAYGYVSYAMEGFRANRLVFSDIPALGKDGPAGSALGGTGIAVSAFSKAREAAIDYAYWVASGDVQKTLFAQAGGQPGHADGWEDDAVNAATGDFYRNTRQSHERAYVRPRHRGYMAFQKKASEALNESVRQNRKATDVIATLNALYKESF